MWSRVGDRTPTANCDGATVAPGTLGAYAVNFYDIKNACPAQCGPSVTTTTLEPRMTAATCATPKIGHPRSKRTRPPF